MGYLVSTSTSILSQSVSISQNEPILKVQIFRWFPSRMKNEVIRIYEFLGGREKLPRINDWRTGSFITYYA